MKSIKIAIIILALSGSVIVYFITRSGADPIPDTEESATEWMCRDCRHVFSLTAREAADEYARAEGRPPLFCPACGEKKAYRVATCPNCGTKYFGFDVPGETGACPKCFPDEPYYVPVPPLDEPTKPEVTETEPAATENHKARKKGPPVL